MFMAYNLLQFQAHIEGLQTTHGNEVTKLQKQIDDLENDVIRLQIQNSELKEHPNASMERYNLIKLLRIQYHIIYRYYWT